MSSPPDHHPHPRSRSSSHPTAVPPKMIPLPQILLALIIILSTLGTYLAVSPPNPPSPTSTTTTNHPDLIRSLLLTEPHSTDIAMAPVFLLSLHTALLVLFYPAIPSGLLRPWGSVSTDGNGAGGRLNAALVTWSASTVIPLALIFVVGIPLRLVSYGALGTDFTFTLAEPDRLEVGGVYSWVQHPSYTGIVAVILGNLGLLGRVDGVLGCWVPRGWFAVGRRVYWWGVMPAVVVGVLGVIWRRVVEEEVLLRGRFGGEWEGWSVRTARFVPGVF